MIKRCAQDSSASVGLHVESPEHKTRMNALAQHVQRLTHLHEEWVLVHNIKHFLKQLFSALVMHPGLQYTLTVALIVEMGKA